jgi:pilus assembly protein CpaD
MKKIATCTILAMATALAGCNSPSGYANRSLESIRQPVVESSQHIFDLTTYGGDISPAELARLGEWADAIGMRSSDQIALEDGSLYSSGSALTAIRGELAKRGASISGVVSNAASTLGSGMMRLRLTRSIAHVPDCPVWSSRYTADPYNSTSSNYGCATNSNLAAMVANPNDLVRGQSAKDDNTQHGVRAITTYRKKELTGAGELKENATSSEGGGSQ